MPSTRFCETIAFSPQQTTRVFEAATTHGLRVKLHADQLSDLAARRWRRDFSALSADHLEYTDEAGIAAMANARHVAVLLPGAFYFLRETKQPPVASSAQTRRAHRARDRLQSRHFAADFAAARDEHGGDAFPSDCRRMHCGRHARGGARARADRYESARWKQAKICDLAIWNIEQPAELVYRMGFNPLHARVWRRPMTAHRHGSCDARRGAADRFHAACRHEIPAEHRSSFVSPWLARKDADWWVDQLYDFAPSSARP